MLRQYAYPRIWLIGPLAASLRWHELWAFGVYASDVTGSPTAVAGLLMVRLVPLALFGVIIGAVADLTSARRLLILGISMPLGG